VREARDIPMTVVLVVAGGTEVVVGQVRERRPDLALVDSLARLQLLGRRYGWRVELRDVPEDLRGLLQLVGLDGVLALEARGEPELGEELGVQEVVQPGDAPVVDL
jgi:hypothetical protein